MGGLEGPPKPPNARAAPAKPWRPSTRGAPKPPNARAAPAKPWRPSTRGAPQPPQTFGAPGVNPGAPLPPPSIRRAGAVVPSRHEIDRLRDHRRVRALAARGPDRRRRPAGKPPPPPPAAAPAAERRHL